MSAAALAASDYDSSASAPAAAQKDQKENPAHTELLTLARDRFTVVSEAESVLRQEQLIDKRFRAGEQWNDKDRATRTADKRPCLTVNRIPQFLKQVTGAQRQNRQEIQINAVDDFGDPETAEVLQGLVKHIENVSNAQVAYDTAADDQATMGRGYIRIVTEYCDDESFEQDIKIKRIRNAHSVYYDPRCVEPDYSDAMFAFVTTDYSIEEFKRRFPDADHTRLDDDAFDSLADHKQLWFIGGTTIRVAEYFYVEFEKIVIARLSDGRSMEISKALQEVTAQQQQVQQAILAGWQPDPGFELLAIEDTRKGTRRVVKWAKINGLQVLEEGTWAGKWIPLIPVLGDEIDLDGRVDYRGIVRDARDQQRLYNFQVSALVETIGLAPRAPWVIAAGQVDTYEKYWKSANQKSWAYLPYKAINVNGTFAPPPQRQTFEPAIAAIVAAIQQADNDLKATTGFYDASLGERGPEQSGKAILARQKQGEIGSVHYVDNLGRALRTVGVQLLDLIPKVMDVPRVVRIIGPDETKKSVMVHAGNADAVPDELPKGVKGVYDLGVGRYDVVVGSGTNRATQRQEAVEMMTAAVQANPELMQIIGDLYFGAMDWPRARQISERLKKFLPPQAQDDENGEDPNQLKAKLGQLEMQLQEKTLMLQEAAETIRTDKVKSLHQKEIKQLEARIELVKLQMTLAQKNEQVDRQIRHDERKQVRQFAAEEFRDERQLTAAREDTLSDRQFDAAGTILEAELSQLDAERQSTEAERIQAEQRDEAREDRAFQGQQADAGRQHEAQQGDVARQHEAMQAEAARRHEAQQAQQAARQQAAAAKKPAAKGKKK